ncbi:MAG: hypothetical protein R3F55_08400 [Alphaproteobacteria bacterium]
MTVPAEQELRLREARVEGAEQALDALRQATLALERRAAGFDAEVRRLQDRQGGALRWTVGAILGLGGILAAVAIVLITGEAAERRSLDARLTAELAGLSARIDSIDATLARLAAQASATEAAAEQSRGAADGLAAQFAALQQRIDASNHRTDMLLGRLGENIDNIRSDFAYLVEGGGARTGFAGQIFLKVPYPSPDADATGSFISDVEVSVLSAAGQLRAGTLRMIVPARDDAPRQRVTFTLNMQFLVALGDLVAGTGAAREDRARQLLRIADVETLMTAFYEADAWTQLTLAVADSRLTDFVIDQRPVVGE